MPDDVPLTDLCSICHVNAIKYTCPRCSVHTCSLPCVQKHKLWAQCSGIRDPAEYRKRSELATESSIDKDFNFISGVERSLERADNHVTEHGLVLAPARHIHPNAHRPRHEVEIEERGVIVQCAPKGLSRSKQNKTHWANQHKCVMWTIEWVCQDGEKVVGQGLETRKIGDAYVNAVGKKTVSKKRKRAVENMSRPEAVQKSGPQTSEPQSSTAMKRARASSDDTDSQHPSALNEELNTKNGAITNQHEDLLTGTYFYLHRPNTMANMKCLVPLQPESTLRDILPGRTVLEFPTIHVRYEPPEVLATPFITDEEYLKRYGKDIPINVVAAPEEGEINEDETDPLKTMIDEKKVLEVLAKDFTTSNT